MPLINPVTQVFLREFCRQQSVWSALHAPDVSRVQVWEGGGTPVHLPAGSRSQIWELQTPGGELVARFHCYRGPSGNKLGQPDPKYIRWGQFIFYIGQNP